MRTLSTEQQIRLVRLVLAQTKFANDFYDAEGELLEFLSELHFDKRFYVSIAPEIRFEYTIGTHTYKHTVDLRKLNLFDPDCPCQEDEDGNTIKLYWETGGGCLDDGTPHTHFMCYRCGHEKIRTVTRAVVAIATNGPRSLRDKIKAFLISVINKL